MTRDDIIRMALEVGFVAYGEDAGEYRIPTPAFHGRLERFANLIAAAEREACIDLVAMYGGPVDLEAAIRARGEK